MKQHPDKKCGQIVLVFAFMILGLLLLALVNVDVFVATRSKGRLQNAGDSAALAAARWQGITLNAIGALNLAQVDVACQYADAPGMATNLLAGIQHLQERLAFAGPLAGLFAAQQIAKENGVPKNDDMTHLTETAVFGAANCLPPTPTWPTKAEDYAEMLRGAMDGGIRAGCENALYFNYSANASHPLYNKSFYSAVWGGDWCHFFFRKELYDLLQNFSGWGEVPTINLASPQNSEFFGVNVEVFHGALADVDPDRNLVRMRQNVLDRAADCNCKNVTPETFDRSGVLTNQFDYVWMTYGPDWRRWDEMHVDGEERLPLRSDVQPRYDVFGASAATRVITTIKTITPNVPDRDNVWTAAAKPFGEINGRTVTLDGEFPLVTPAFTDVRLIMLAGASEGRLNMADAEWVEHTRDHIQNCTQGHFADGCPYCNILKLWEDKDYRNIGVQWLAVSNSYCRPPIHGRYTSPRGGTRHAR